MEPKNTVTINFFGSRPLVVEYNPGEPTWMFSKSVGERVPGAITDGGNTSNIGLFLNNKGINTFANRMKPIGEFLGESVKHICAINLGLKMRQEAFWRGNASPAGADRSICVICLEEIKEAHSGKRDNPLIAVALQCSHAFHRGCLNRYRLTNGDAGCPLCRAPVAVWPL